MVEEEGFEPSVRYRTPAFQASKLNRSDILPRLRYFTQNYEK